MRQLGMSQFMSVFAFAAFILGTAVLGSAWTAPALTSAERPGQQGSVVMLAMDEENRAVEEDLRPDEVPEGMEDAPKEPKESMTGDADRGDGDIEDEMIDKIGPGAQ